MRFVEVWKSLWKIEIMFHRPPDGADKPAEEPGTQQAALREVFFYIFPAREYPCCLARIEENSLKSSSKPF